MNFHSAKYLTLEGARSVWTNRLMSLASTGVLFACMLLIGFAIMISENLDKAVGALQQQNVIMAFFEDDLDEPTISARIETMKSVPNVATVEFIPRAQGLERMIKDMGPEYAALFQLFEGEEKTILPDSVQISFVDLQKFDQSVGDIRNIPGVARVNSKSEIASTLDNLRKTLNTACYWIIGLLMVVALVIISNTIRITMYSRKLEISIMKAVGATNGFVRFPFIIEGLILGILAASLTIVVLRFSYLPLANTLTNASLAVIPFRAFVWKLYGLFLSIGLLSGLVSSVLMIGRYLRKEGSEFRAL